VGGREGVTVGFSARICVDLTGASDSGQRGESGPLPPLPWPAPRLLFETFCNNYYNASWLLCACRTIEGPSSATSASITSRFSDRNISGVVGSDGAQH